MSFCDLFRNVYYGRRELLLREVEADSTFRDLECGQAPLVRYLPDGAKKTCFDFWGPKLEISPRNKMLHCWKALGESIATPGVKSEKLSNCVSFLSEVFIYSSPNLSFHIFSVKDMSQFS